MHLCLRPRRKVVKCEVAIDAPWKDEAFTQLHEQKERIENALGFPLQWDNDPEKKTAYIRREEALDPEDESLKQQVLDWFANTSIAFYRVFAPRIRKLKQPLEEKNEDALEG